MQPNLPEGKTASMNYLFSKSRTLNDELEFDRFVVSSEITTFSSQHVITSTHFSVHYNSSGSDATTHDYAQNISDALEYSWTTEVENFGFREPPDSFIDVYLKDLPAGILGRTIPAWHNQTGWHVGYISIDVNITPLGLANVTCSHEFFHTIQMSYLPLPDSFPSPAPPNAFEKGWITEGMAVWIESKVYPTYVGFDSYVVWVNNYMNNPDRMLTDINYSAVLYWIFLDEQYGGIGTLENIMQQTTRQDGIYAVNVTLNGKGTTFTEVFKEWSIANYLKDSYSEGGLFDQIATSQIAYAGTEILHNRDVVDWGVDYFEITSSVIYMPIQFAGLQSHNLTRILLEYGLPLVSDLPLNSSYVGNFSLMQANNLDSIIIIVRSLGNETSTNRVGYSLIFLSSTYTLQGPHQLTSSTITITAIKTTYSHFSSPLTLTTVKIGSSQSSSTSIISAVSSSSSQCSSPETTTVVGSSSSKSSSETPLNVTLPPTPVGGIYIPVNKLELLAPYIGLTILLALAVVTVGYVKKRKRHREINS